MAQLHRVGRFTTPPDFLDIESMAIEAYAHLPEELRRYGNRLRVEVLDFPTDQMMEANDSANPFDMLGLYDGDAPIKDAATAFDRGTDTLYLFRRPILDFWCDSGEDLAEVVSEVLFLEIGHYLGFSEEDMEQAVRKAQVVS